VRSLGLADIYQGALDVLDEIPTADPEVAVRATLERGRVLNSSGSPEAARPLFESAFAAATEAGFEHLAVDALHMVAIVAPASEQEALNRQALALAAAADDPRARDWRASLLNNLGWTLFDRGDAKGALAIFEDALAARVAQGKVREIQIARWCIGRALRELGRYDEARAIQQALAAEHAAAGTPDQFVQEELAELESAMKSDPRAGSPQNQE
jgi:tetratricopeptide (TPR) repeat protein